MGQDAPSRSERFKLYNLCAPMGLRVESVPSDLAAVGLSSTQVTSLAEGRLQLIDLFEADALTTLRVEASRHAVQVQYLKPVVDVASSETETIQTYSSSAKVRDGTVASVLLELSKLLDSFLLEYLRVNGSACKDDDSPKRTERVERANPPVGGSEPKPRPEPSPRRTEPIERAGPPLAGPGPKPRPERTNSQDGIRWGRTWPVPEPPETERTVHRSGAGVTSPRLTYKVEPEYSEEARDLKIQGTVMLGFEVWEDGRGHNFEVLRSVGHGLDEKAIEAVRRWKFEPGKKDGNPVRVQVQAQVRFRLLVNPRNR